MLQPTSELRDRIVAASPSVEVPEYQLFEPVAKLSAPRTSKRKRKAAEISDPDILDALNPRGEDELGLPTGNAEETLHRDIPSVTESEDPSDVPVDVPVDDPVDDPIGDAVPKQVSMDEDSVATDRRIQEEAEKPTPEAESTSRGRDNRPRSDDEVNGQVGVPTGRIGVEEGEARMPEIPTPPVKTRKIAKQMERKAKKRSRSRETPSEQPAETRTSSGRLTKRPQHLSNAASYTGTMHKSILQLMFMINMCFNMTINDMRTKYPEDWREPIVSELRQFHDMKVGDPIRRPLKNLKHSRILTVRGFGKEKLSTETGDLERLKFRLVPGGHLVDHSLYDAAEKTSPTVTMESVMTSCNIAAYEGMKGFVMDIPGAYLNAELEHPHMVRFPRDLAAMYVELYPEYESYLQDDGTMLLLVTKAFYGLPESSMRWYQVISNFLTEQGFECTAADQGLWQKTDGDEKMILCLWVDDFLGWTTSSRMKDEFNEAVIERFGNSRMQDGKILSFLGMTISQPGRERKVRIGLDEYTKRIVDKSGVTTDANNPNHRYLTHKKPATGRHSVDPKNYLSLLMSAMFLGKRTRPEILAALSILGTRSTNPDNYDLLCLLQVYKYLKKTIDYKLCFSPKSITLHYWIDAAYGSHDDGRGHSGLMATIGLTNAPVWVRSAKQKLVARSSTESELVALDEGCLHLLWFRLILEFLGYPQQPAVIAQDNKSTIVVCESGHSRSGRIKHMSIRFFFIKSLIDSGKIRLKYVPTRDMIADILTKPLVGSMFSILRDKLLNMC